MLKINVVTEIVEEDWDIAIINSNGLVTHNRDYVANTNKEFIQIINSMKRFKIKTLPKKF